MPRFERKALMEKFQEMKRRRIPIVGGGAGTGLSAKCEEEGGIDLIVMRSHRPKFSTYLLGSNAAHIVRHAPCSVFVVREGNS